MPRARTPFNACSVKFSPFLEQRIAVATSQNFGIIGNGRQHVFDVSFVPKELLPVKRQPCFCTFRLWC